MTLNYSSVQSFKEIHSLLNSYTPNTILISSIIPPPSSSELTKESFSKMSSRKSWTIRSKSGIHLRSTTNLYNLLNCRSFQGPTLSIRTVQSARSIIKIIIFISLHKNIDKKFLPVFIISTSNSCAESTLTFGKGPSKRLMSRQNAWL